jgi:hypothetical protein
VENQLFVEKHAAATKASPPRGFIFQYIIMAQKGHSKIDSLNKKKESTLFLVVILGNKNVEKILYPYYSAQFGYFARREHGEYIYEI